MKTKVKTNWHIRAYEQLSGRKLSELKQAFAKPVLLNGGCLLYQLPNHNSGARN